MAIIIGHFSGATQKAIFWGFFSGNAVSFARCLWLNAILRVNRQNFEQWFEAVLAQGADGYTHLRLRARAEQEWDQVCPVVTAYFTSAHLDVRQYFQHALGLANANAYSRKIQNLRRTRDLLLPRLLSGQVNFKEN